MVSRHCNACGNDNHPKLRHPSSLKVEVAIWTTAILVGLVAGIWSAGSEQSGRPITRALQSLAFTSAQPDDSPAEISQGGARQPRNTGIRTIEAAYGMVGNFLRTAWWVLPLPILFSLWRQAKHYEVCRVCGSRDVVPVEAPHGWEPPL